MNIGPTDTSLGTVTIATDGTITLTAHGLSDGDAVAFDTLTDGADGVIEEGEAYYVRNSTTDTFQVSGSRGGPILTFAATGGAAVYSAAPAYPAETLRQIASHHAFHGSANRLGAREGVRPGAGDPISVSGTTWKVETHTGTVEPAGTVTQGPYDYVCLEDTGSLDPADASNDRLDALDLKIEDDDADASGYRRARIIYTAGTASGTPAAPAAVDSALRLGTISVPASGGDDPSVSTTAPWTVASGGILPVTDENGLPTTGRYPGMTAWDQTLKILRVWDGSNWALNPGQLVAVLRLTSAQSIPQNTDTPISFGSAALDLLGGWSSSNPSRYSPTVAGTYEFTGGVSIQDGPGISQLQCFGRVNGSSAAGGSHIAIGTGGIENPSAPLRDCTVNFGGTSGYFEMMARHDSNGSQATATTSARHTTLLVHYAAPLYD